MQHRKSTITLEGKDLSTVKFDDIVAETQRMFFLDLFSGKFNPKSTFWQICNVVADWGFTRGYNQAADEVNETNHKGN